MLKQVIGPRKEWVADNAAAAGAPQSHKHNTNKQPRVERERENLTQDNMTIDKCYVVAQQAFTPFNFPTPLQKKEGMCTLLIILPYSHIVVVIQS